MPTRFQAWVEDWLACADIRINGGRSWDMLIRDDRLFARIAAKGTLGLGEAYMEGWWDCAALDEFFSRLLRHQRHYQKLSRTWAALLKTIQGVVTNLQSTTRAFQIGKHHYDMGNDLYCAMLDDRLTYTCAYWKDAQSLNAAQEAKLELVCQKIGLSPGDSVLDIGCGWGSFLKYAAHKYGVHGTGITVAAEQVKLGRELCQGLPIDIQLRDYRGIVGTYDHIVSLGMFEHVGVKNYRTFMKVAARALKDGGHFLLHTIGTNTSSNTADAWITKYIFPNSMLPSIRHIGQASEELFVMEDWHNFGADYDRTLMAWFANFDRSWPTLQERFSPVFYRMWKYFLLSCAGSFRSRYLQVWQIVLSKLGVLGGYRSIR